MEIISDISIIFISIFVEALPFLLMGSLISSIIERYISNEMIVKLIPKNIFLGTITGIFLGFFIPACDCAVIPISKRLIKKNIPLNVAISFMLASPIINPVVLFSTYYAFSNSKIEIFWYRITLGVLVSFIVGIIMSYLYPEKVIKEDKHICNHINCSHCHLKPIKSSYKEDIIFILKHTIIDITEVLRYLMFGALLASLIQVLLPQPVMLIFKDNRILSIIVLMLFAYLISLCSTSDSFVGKSLLGVFPNQAIVAYLLLGPMIDIKNTVVLLGNYKKNFVISLISFIFIIIFIAVIVVVKI